MNFIIDNDPQGYFKFASLQSREGASYVDICSSVRFRTPADKEYDVLSSLILIEGGMCYRQSTAALRIARQLKGPWPALYVLRAIPAPLRDKVYSWVAKNRYRWFGKQETCRIPTPELRARFLDQVTT